MANGRGHYFQINNSFFVCVCRRRRDLIARQGPSTYYGATASEKSRRIKKTRDLREKPDCFFFFFFFLPVSISRGSAFHFSRLPQGRKEKPRVFHVVYLLLIMS
jgi:hypothetical protein